MPLTLAFRFLLGFVSFVAVATVVAAESVAAPRDAMAVVADDWNSLLDRRSGWTGADGIFAANLDGTITSGLEKRPGQKTLFVFSDTILGDIDPQTLIRSNVAMVNHSFAVLDGNTPDAARLAFFYPTDGRTPRLPIKPPRSGEWYWLSECFVLGGKLHTFLLRMERQGDGAFGFRHLGVDRATFDLDANGVVWDSLRVTHDDPFAPKLAVFSHAHTVALGCGILENTEEAGVVGGDGFVYLYGFREGSRGAAERALVAARFRPAEIETPQAWRYWAGAEKETGDGHWSEALRDAAAIVAHTATELSVVPIESGPAKGKYALVYTPGTIGSRIALRIGPTPVGPFGRERIVFEEKETRRIGGGAFAYNAKAHPVLSATGELLISYNINSMDTNMRIFKEGGIYYPRFVRLALDTLPAE